MRDGTFSRSPEFRDRLKDLALAIALAVLGVLGYLHIGQEVASGLLEQQDITFATLPSVWCGLLVVLSLVYAASVVIDLARLRAHAAGERREGAAKAEPPRVESRLIVRILVTVVALVVFAALLGEAPFFLLVVAFLAVTLVAYGRPARWPTLALAVAGGAAFHVLFVWMLKLPL